MTPLASPGLRLTTAPGGFNPPQHRSPFTPAAYGGDLRPNTVPMNHMFGHFLQPSAELTLLPMLDTYTVRLPLPRTQRGHLSLEIGSGPCPCPPVCTLQRGGQSPGSKRVAPNSSSLAQLTRGNGERVSEYSRRMAADGVPEHAHARSGTPSCALLGPRAAGRVEYGESTPPTLAPSMMPSQTSSSAPSAAPSLAPSAGSRTQAPTDAPRSSPSHKHHRRKQGDRRGCCGFRIRRWWRGQSPRPSPRSARTGAHGCRPPSWATARRTWCRCASASATRKSPRRRRSRSATWTAFCRRRLTTCRLRGVRAPSPLSPPLAFLPSSDRIHCCSFPVAFSPSHNPPNARRPTETDSVEPTKRHTILSPTLLTPPV